MVSDNLIRLLLGKAPYFLVFFLGFLSSYSTFTYFIHLIRNLCSFFSVITCYHSNFLLLSVSIVIACSVISNTQQPNYFIAHYFDALNLY